MSTTIHTPAQGGRGFAPTPHPHLNPHSLVREQFLVNSSLGAEERNRVGVKNCTQRRPLLQSVKSQRHHRNLGGVRQRHKNSVGLPARREPAGGWRAAGTSAAAPRVGVRRGGKQEAPSSPVAFFNA